MDSANIHHQLQDQSVGSATHSCYGDGSTAHANWTPNSILNTHGFSSYPSETVLNPRQQENTILSSQYSSMAPDLGFHWANNTGNFYSSNGAANNGLRDFSQIFPSIYVSNLNHSFTHPCSLDMNLHALDHLPTSSRFCGNFSPSSENRIELSRDGFCYNDLDHMQQSHHMPLHSSNKLSASSNGLLAETKRTSSNMEPKSLQTASKKSRLQQPRVSCPPFKVRKEKLGDRIAALQQLVAPFGKTDTASVLMEAIGYIKFLQNQVETLSVPYMKTSRNKTSTIMKRGSAENDIEEPKRDLKSIGLCLVPLSCLSYITDGGGGVVWPPPHFGGAT